MTNAYTIKSTPESTDSITISDVTGAIFKATLGSLPGTSSAVGGYVDPPVYSDSSGIKGQYSFDEEYVYMCIADNSWDRFPVTWDAWGTAAPENPVILSATIDVSGGVLSILFDRNVFQGSAYIDSDFNLDASIGGSDIGITYSSGNGTRTRFYSISTTIRGGETVDIDYSGRANGLEDASGNDLLSISSMSVTNLSEDLYSDIVFWDGFEGTITGTTYESTNYDYPPFHTGAVPATVSMSTGFHSVGQKSLRINGGASPFTISGLSIPCRSGRAGFWLRSDADVGNNPLFALRFNTNVISINYANTTRINVYASYSTPVYNVNTTIVSIVGAWHFLEIRWDLVGGSFSFYIDGVELSNSPFNGDSSAYFTEMIIGPVTGINGNDMWGYYDNMIISTDPNRDLYAMALLESYPG